MLGNRSLRFSFPFAHSDHIVNPFPIAGRTCSSLYDFLLLADRFLYLVKSEQSQVVRRREMAAYRRVTILVSNHVVK